MHAVHTRRTFLRLSRNVARAAAVTRGCAACIRGPHHRAPPYRLRRRVQPPRRRPPRPSRATGLLREETERRLHHERTTSSPPARSVHSARRRLAADSAHSTSERTGAADSWGTASHCRPARRRAACTTRDSYLFAAANTPSGLSSWCFHSSSQPPPPARICDYGCTKRGPLLPPTRLAAASKVCACSFLSLLLLTYILVAYPRQTAVRLPSRLTYIRERCSIIYRLLIDISIQRSVYISFQTRLVFIPRDFSAKCKYYFSN